MQFQGVRPHIRTSRPCNFFLTYRLNRIFYIIAYRQNVVTFPSLRPSSFRCFLALSFESSERVPSRMARSSSSSSGSWSWQDTKPLSGRDIGSGSISSNQRSTFAEELSCFEKLRSGIIFCVKSR